MARFVRIIVACPKCGTSAVVVLTRKQIKDLYRVIKQPGEMGTFKV